MTITEWKPIETLWESEGGPGEIFIMAPSLICADFNPSGLAIGVPYKAVGNNYEYIEVAKWYDSGDRYISKEVRDAKFWCRLPTFSPEQ